MYQEKTNCLIGKPTWRSIIAFSIGMNAMSLSVAWSETVSQIDAIEQTYHLHSKHTLAEVVIEKHYASNSEFRGLFGAGWCSDLDGKIETYADKSIRYLGCDIGSARLIDPRLSVNSVSKTSTGFSRLREDGAIQSFDRRGRLVGLLFSEKNKRQPLVLLYDDKDKPERIVSVQSRVDVFYSEEFRFIQSFRGQSQVIHFSYRNDLLISNETETYLYDRQRNLRNRASGNVSEAVDYHHDRGMVAKIERRIATSPGERLVISLDANDESGEIEINAERGAEMHPVRILYHIKQKTLELVGDQETARQIFAWIKS